MIELKTNKHVLQEHIFHQHPSEATTTIMQPQNLFVNYTHPSQQGDRQQRQKVASYIGTHYRNRSRPQARRRNELVSARTNANEITDQHATGEKQQASGMQVLSWRLEPQTVSLLSIHDMHGFKVDPFKSYPIPYTENLPRALEYFLQAYGPTHLVRSHLSRCSPPKDLLQRYVQYSMQDAAMFGSIITLSFATMSITLWTAGQPDVETSRYYGDTLVSLRAALTTNEGITEDATILAILSLIRFEYLIGNSRAYHAHSAALRGLIAHRGGIDRIGWSGIIVPAIAGAITRANFFHKVSNTPLSTVPGSSSLDDLKPYTPPDIPGRILAPGIQLLVDTGRLSESVVRLAKATFQNPEIDIRHNNSAIKNAYNTELTEHLEYLLHSETLSLADEILMISMHRELYDLASNERYSVLYKDFVIHWTNRALEMIEEISFDDTPLVEMFIWVSFKHAGTMVAPFLNMMSEDTNDPRFQLMLRVLERFSDARDWSSAEVLLTKFTPMRECLYWWHLIWQRVKVRYEELTRV